LKERGASHSEKSRVKEAGEPKKELLAKKKELTLRGKNNPEEGP